MEGIPADLAAHPDRLRWNARYEAGPGRSFEPHPLARAALDLALPDGPVLDLACGASGSALLAAAAGRAVTAVDVSDVALGLLTEQARRRGLDGLISCVQADLGIWRPQPDRYALVLCTGYWDRALFPAAAAAVAAGGALGWEAFTTQALEVRPGLNPEWCLRPGEPSSVLPAGFAVLEVRDLPGGEHGSRRRLLAQRQR
jgi:SAM-dependent methyltransferase